MRPSSVPSSSRRSSSCSVRRRGGHPGGSGTPPGPRSADGNALAVERAQERLDDLGVELLPRPASELLAGCDRTDRHPVDAVARHRLVSVADGENRGLDRNLFLAQAIRIAGPIRALVVAEDPAADIVELAARENPCTELRMPPHLRHLLVGERTGLAEDRVGDPDLADVVEDARET